MARSSSRGRRSVAARVRDGAPSDPPGTASAPAPPPLTSATLPRVWQGLGYRLLADAAPARSLFDFAAVAWPAAPLTFCWGASDGERLLGALLGTGTGTSLVLHGPVVVTDREPIEVAAQLVGAGLDHARALGIETVFARPLGLDRIWIRFGFIPVPEGALPRDLDHPPGSGLYAWRGGTALWTFRESTRD